ncbi:autotransporter domain-containing protein [Paraburkholderia hayleyella]|uniref:autotransporter domain-containing protein n=1 Tax=Paraburkholderia hayleyella TaxID=2152889 RepID=UPI001292B189|nr:autotransporter domain-containing protein [Paraburkholderia hayleyella]
MNRIYSVVWNSTLRLLQVASEQVRSRGGKPGRKRVRGVGGTRTGSSGLARVRHFGRAHLGNAALARPRFIKLHPRHGAVMTCFLLAALMLPLEAAWAYGEDGAAGTVINGSSAENSTVSAGGNGGAGAPDNSGGGDGGGGGGGGGGGIWVQTSGTTLSNLSGATAEGGAGGAGGASVHDNGGGGGGGGSGIALDYGTVTNDGVVLGGAGGAGGAGGDIGGNGGNGGGGGDGLVTTGTGEGQPVTITNSGSIQGGAGGNGASSPGYFSGSAGAGGNGVAMAGGTLNNNGSIEGGQGGTTAPGWGAGGDGGAGIWVSGNTQPTTINNGQTGTITGGAGQAGGDAGTTTPNGVGGAGIAGANLNIINAGTITGGVNTDGGRANAVTFTGGSNTFELDAGGNVIGNVDATAASGGTNTLALGGDSGTSATFRVEDIGAQYLGFQQYAKNGAGTWTLTGSTTEVTPWTLNDGTLSISANRSLGADSGTLTFNGGTLNTRASIEMARAISITQENGTIDTDAGTTLTASGTISGDGRLTKNGGGTLTLSGANTYSGGTVLQEGTVSIGADNNLGDSNGTLTFNGGTLNTTGTFATQRAITITQANGTIDTNSGTALTANGAISGDGSLTKTGAGTLTLSGNNTYEGGTVIQEGTVSVSADTNLGNSAGGLTLNDSTLNTSGTFATARAIALQGGGGTIDTHAATALTANGEISGDGALTKTGAGTLTLLGNNTYTGGTVLDGGTLELGADNNLGAAGTATGGLTFNSGILRTLNGFSTNRTLQLNGTGGMIDTASETLTWNGTISGAGRLSKTGNGELYLTGQNLYTGGTLISAGMLTVDSSDHGLGVGSGGLNTVNVAAGVSSSAMLRFVGNSSADGLTITTGARSTTIFDDHSVAGNAQLILNAQGRLMLAGAAQAPGATVTNNAGGFVDISALTASGTAIGSLAGEGSVALGSRTLTLGGLNRDDVINGAINDGGSGGTLLKTGSGALTLNGINTYTGGTNIAQGMLTIGDITHLNASTAGDVQVSAAGTLRGYGAVGGSVVNQGLVWPGSPTGTLSVGGNYQQGANGTLQIDVSPTSASQLKVGGSAALGGTLSLLYAPGTYRTISYQIVSSQGLSGDFSNVSTNGSEPQNLKRSINLSQSGVVLSLGVPTPPVPPDPPDPPDPPGPPTPPINPNPPDTPPGPVVVAPTNATLFGALGSAAMREGQQVNDLLLERMSRLCADASASVAGCLPLGRHAWVQTTGAIAQVGGNSGAPGYTDRRYGFLAGIERQVNAWTVGVAAGYSHADITEQQTGSSGKIDTLRIAGYGGRSLGPVNIAGTWGYAHDFLASSRNFGSFGNADGNSQGDEMHLGAQVSLPLTVGPLLVTPRAGLRYQYFHGHAFDESGPTSQNLVVGMQNLKSLQPYVGVTAGYPFMLLGERPGLVEARLGYAYETLDPSRSMAVTAADGTSFIVPGATSSRGMLSAGLGVKLPLRKTLDLNAGYDTLIHTGNVSGQALRLSLTYRF